MASTILLSDNGASSGSAGLKTTGGNDGVLVLQTTTSGGTPNSALTINNRGDIGVAITPSTWSTGKSIQFPNGAIGTYGTSDLEIGSNYYYSSPNYKYYANGYSDLLALYNNNFQIQSATSGTADANITYTQTLAVGLGTSLALQGATSKSGTGITFPATQSASTDVNTLDDYEEGTWTPSITFGGGSTGVSYSSYRDASYIKVGKQVTVTGILFLNNKGSSTGFMEITGLPFQIANGNSYFAGAGAHFENLTYTGYPCITIDPNVTKFSISQMTEAGTSSGLTNSNAANNFQIRFTFSYVASA